MCRSSYVRTRLAGREGGSVSTPTLRILAHLALSNTSVTVFGLGHLMRSWTAASNQVHEQEEA